MPSNNTEQKAVNLGQLKMAYQAGALLPVDVTTLQPTGNQFPKNAALVINGVFYRASRATSQLPCTFMVDDQTGQFVVDTVDGESAFVVSDPTPNSDWQAWSDARPKYWIAQTDQRLSALETMLAGISPNGITLNGTTYTLQQLLEALATLMGKTVVTKD